MLYVQTTTLQRAFSAIQQRQQTRVNNQGSNPVVFQNVSTTRLLFFVLLLELNHLQGYTIRTENPCVPGSIPGGTTI